MPLLLTDELTEALTPKHTWGRWDVDFNDAQKLIAIPDYLSQEEKLYVFHRARGYSNAEVRQLMGKSIRTMYHYQTGVFWKYHYALYLQMFNEQNTQRGETK